MHYLFYLWQALVDRLKAWGECAASGMPGTLGATYVAYSGEESGSGHFIPHYMSTHVKYLPPEAPSFFL